jgi:hypothetical protein
MKKVLLYSTLFIFLVAFLQFSGCTITRDAVTYVSLSLNPSVEFVLDTSNRVVSVNALNDDGELLLSIENVEGREIKQVIKELLTTASESGLFDVDSLNGLVSITVINEDAEFSMILSDLLKEVCETYFKTNGIYALAASGSLPEEVLQLAKEYELPPGHLYLMLKLQTLRPDLNFADIVTLPIKEVVGSINEELKLVGKVHLKAQKQAYKNELMLLKETYEQNIRTLFGQEYSTLLDELDFLQSQIEGLEGEALTNLKEAILQKEQQIEALKNQLEVTYQTEYLALKQSYEANRQQLKDQYVEEAKAQLTALKQSMQTRIEEKKSFLQARIAYAKNRRNAFSKKYETFVALQKADLYNFFKTKLEELSMLESEALEELNTAIEQAKEEALLQS